MPTVLITGCSSGSGLETARHFPGAYAETVKGVFTGWEQDTGPVTPSSDVAQAVWRAATDRTWPAKLPAGPDPITWTGER